jgi:AraC-like DNA-binding protein
MSIRSSEKDCSEGITDPIAEVLQDFRLSGSHYCRSELRAPWGLEIPACCGASFHFVAEGGCYLRQGACGPLRLDGGDLVLLPRGGGYTLCSSPDGETVSVSSLTKEAIGKNANLLRWEGPGELTTLVGGAVRFENSDINPLLDLMPEVLHLRGGDGEQDEVLRGMVAAMSAEARSVRPGGATLMTRLADALVVHAVRWWLDHGTEECTGWLKALRDPQVGRALAAIHRRPQEAWTVASLAKAVHMSRSVFSARFTEFVGTSPMHYLTRWRMHLAERWLREDRLGIGEVAARLGYESGPSFSRAFKRHTGASPGEARRNGSE